MSSLCRCLPGERTFNPRILKGCASNGEVRRQDGRRNANGVMSASGPVGAVPVDDQSPVDCWETLESDPHTSIGDRALTPYKPTSDAVVHTRDQFVPSQCCTHP